MPVCSAAERLIRRAVISAADIALLFLLPALVDGLVAIGSVREPRIVVHLLVGRLTVATMFAGHIAGRRCIPLRRLALLARARSRLRSDAVGACRASLLLLGLRSASPAHPPALSSHPSALFTHTPALSSDAAALSSHPSALGAWVLTLFSHPSALAACVLTLFSHPSAVAAGAPALSTHPAALGALAAVLATHAAALPAGLRFLLLTRLGAGLAHQAATLPASLRALLAGLAALAHRAAALASCAGLRRGCAALTHRSALLIARRAAFAAGAGAAASRQSTALLRVAVQGAALAFLLQIVFVGGAAARGRDRFFVATVIGLVISLASLIRIHVDSFPCSIRWGGTRAARHCRKSHHARRFSTAV